MQSKTSWREGEGSSGVLVEESAVSRCVHGVRIGQEVVAVAQTRVIVPVSNGLKDVSIRTLCTDLAQCIDVRVNKCPVADDTPAVNHLEDDRSYTSPQDLLVRPR